jgi:hypothetical protein
MIEKESRQLMVRGKKKFDPMISKCYNCMFCNTMRNNNKKIKYDKRNIPQRQKKLGK